MMPLSRPAVLILSTNPAFVRELAAQWPTDQASADACPPEFTVLGDMLSPDLGGNHYDLAIGDCSSPQARSALRNLVASTGKAAILIESGADEANPDGSFPRMEKNIIVLRRDEARRESSSRQQTWSEIAGLLGRQILLRAVAEAGQRAAESLTASAHAEATLGRYMVEMRHNVNNALTSILGNAELLAAEPGLPGNVLVQADTIRNMALRLHEVFQRFSSIEKELSVAARETVKASARAAATGAS